MQIKVNRFKTDLTWFNQISGKKIINKSLQSTVQKAPELRVHSHSCRLCQFHPAIVSCPSFPERGWSDGMTFSNQSQFHILSQPLTWAPLKGKKYVQDCYIVASHLPCRPSDSALCGVAFPFRDRATCLWPWPGFKFHALKTVHTSYHQIQQDICGFSTCFCVETTCSTFQLKMWQTFGFPIPSATEQSMQCQSVATRQGQPKDIFPLSADLYPSNGLCWDVATYEIKATFGIGIGASARQRNHIACSVEMCRSTTGIAVEVSKQIPWRTIHAGFVI